MAGAIVPELSRVIDTRQADGKSVSIEADANERAALARRFAIPSVDRLFAQVELRRTGDTVHVEGKLEAAIVQSCAVSAEDVPQTIAEPLSFRFVPARDDYQPDAEIELDAEELDEIDYDGVSFDLGEAIAQSLALAIDPFAIGPEAESARCGAWISDGTASGPFAVLAQLKKT